MEQEANYIPILEWYIFFINIIYKTKAPFVTEKIHIF